MLRVTVRLPTVASAAGQASDPAPAEGPALAPAASPASASAEAFTGAGAGRVEQCFHQLVRHQTSGTCTLALC
jgi:hypothetical protein